MNNEKLLISDNKSNNSEFKSNKQIEEMAEYIFGNAITHDTRFKEDCRSIAMDLYTAGYRKQSEGEWIWDREHSNYKCSLCGEYDIGVPKFCRECGAKMKGGEGK